MTKFSNVDLPSDSRYREGNHGDVDIYDERVGQFVRVDEGDKVEAHGDGYTVVRKDEEKPAQEVFPEKGHDEKTTDVKIVNPKDADKETTGITVVDPEGDHGNDSDTQRHDTDYDKSGVVTSDDVNQK